jgi:phosphoribosylformimino-5-aminoimidazole carboxamide ribotide isomerase
MARLPTAINLHKASKTLTLTYAPGEVYHLPAEFLRVHSPSAEVQGHGNPILQFGKINVGLSGLEPAGQYALKLTFDDGHDRVVHLGIPRATVPAPGTAVGRVSR